MRPPLTASPAKRTKPMRSVKFLIAAGAASLLSSVAFAADMPDHAAAGLCAAAGRGFRRLVSARRHRHDQPEPERPHAGDGAVSRGLSEHRVWIRQFDILRPRRRLSFQQLVPRRCDRRISRPCQLSRIAVQPGQCDRARLCGNRQLLRQQVRMGGHGQCLCRPRHLVVRDAVHRRRHRRVAQHHQRLPR